MLSAPCWPCRRRRCVMADRHLRRATMAGHRWTIPRRIGRAAAATAAIGRRRPKAWSVTTSSSGLASPAAASSARQALATGRCSAIPRSPPSRRRRGFQLPQLRARASEAADQGGWLRHDLGRQSCLMERAGRRDYGPLSRRRSTIKLTPEDSRGQRQHPIHARARHRGCPYRNLRCQWLRSCARLSGRNGTNPPVDERCRVFRGVSAALRSREGEE